MCHSSAVKHETGESDGRDLAEQSEGQEKKMTVEERLEDLDTLVLQWVNIGRRLA